MDRITFDGRVAIVTGAGGGLGRSYGLELARRGVRVVVNDLGDGIDGTGGSVGPADATVQAIRDNGGEAVASYASVAAPDGGAAIVQTALDAFGIVDILINNAGTLCDRSFANLGVAEVHAVVDVHLLGAFYVTQPAFRVMKEKGYGRLLFTSSAAGPGSPWTAITANGTPRTPRCRERRRPAPMILVTGHIDFDPARRGEFVAALEALRKGSLAEPGCVQYMFSADFEDPGRVHVVEQWESDELMQAHMVTPHAAEFGKVMRSIVRGIKVTKHEVASSQPLFVG